MWKSSEALQFVKAETILDIICENRPILIDLAGETYTLFYNNEAVNPDTYSLKFPIKPNCRINALPSYIGGDFNIAGIKWVSSFPNNIESNKQRASALITINSFETGYPLAILDGTLISSARTVASAVCALRALIPTKKCSSMTCYGAGFIQKDLIQFLVSDGWGIDNINIYDIHSESAEGFADFCGRHEINSKVFSGDDKLIDDSEVISFATTALHPWYDKAFGSNKIVLHMSLRDIVPSQVEYAINIVDDINHAVKANSTLHLMKQKVGKIPCIENFSRLLNGTFQFDGKPVIVAAFGMGILDLAFAHFIMECAFQRKTIDYIEGFNPSRNRL